MTRRAAGNRRTREPRRWSTLSVVAVGAVLSIVLSGSAVAAKGLIQSKDIAKGAVTGKAIRNGAVMPWDLNRSTRMWVKASTAATGAKGDTGSDGNTGATGAAGARGWTGADGSAGSNGNDGTDGNAGTDGSDGIDGTDGGDGTDGIDGTNGGAGSDGIDGTNGTNGTNGTDGVLAQQSATAGLTPLPTGAPPTVVVSMTVPEGNYVVWAKTQLSHTGAGDSIDCALKAGGVTIDQIAMKTLPALAAIPASLQAVTTTSPTQLSLECDVLTANGSADFSSLIAIPAS